MHRRTGLTRSIYILSPAADQAHALALALKGAGTEIIGVVMPGEPRPFTKGPYDRITSLASIDLDGNATVVPTGGLSTAMMLERAAVVLGDVTLTQSSLKFFDKAWSFDIAREAGVPVPKTWLNPEEITEFPVFYKPAREGHGTRGVATSRDKLPAVGSEELVYQELIQTPGTYGVAFIADAGDMTAWCSHFESISYPASGGSAVHLELINNEKLLSHTRAILRTSSYSGWGLAEFKLNNTKDDFVFMEVNAKFWASLEFTLRNNPNFMRRLFGRDYQKKAAANLVFPHRAMGLTLTDLLKNFTTLTSSPWSSSSADMILRYSVVSRIPQTIKSSIKRLRDRKTEDQR